MSNFLGLGQWPSAYGQQVEFTTRLKTALQATNNYVQANLRVPIVLSQASAPTQGQWESAWTAAGKSLPITPNADLYWYDTIRNSVGGVYGTLPGGSTVYLRRYIYPKNSTVLLQSAYKTDQISVTHHIGTQLTNYPSLTFTLPVKCDLELYFALYVKLASGSGQWGADFLLNGVKVGTQYLSIPTNQGIMNANQSGPVIARTVISDVTPGTYTVQSLFGMTNSPTSPPTLTIGGISGSEAYGVRWLIVRAFAKG